MQCFKCNFFIPINNTQDTGHGLCSYSPSYFPVNQTDTCHLIPNELTCFDCDRFGNDTACMTCLPEDSAYHGEDLCAGFIDKNETIIVNALMLMKMRGIDYHAKIKELLKNVDETDLPGQPRENV